jgi:CRISPR system Cascade subunit CasA
MQTNFSFDLRYEPWISALDKEGKEHMLGLQELLLRANELTQIVDPIPIVEFGIYRLLTALVLDIFRIESQDSLKTLLDAGQFDSNEIEAYFDKYRDRFDLFHPNYPFLQTRFENANTPKATSIAKLFPPTPSGTNLIHFQHTYEREFCVGPSAAARLLTTVAPFMTSGGRGLPPSINGAPPWYVLLSLPDSNLFQILCLNCYAVNPDGRIKLGIPAWRRDTPVKQEEKTQTTLLEALTWQPRKILLIPESGKGICALTGQATKILIHQMCYQAGWSTRLQGWCDPAVPYTIDKAGPKALRPQEDRELWRDTGVLVFKIERDGNFARSQRPLLVSQFTELANDGVLGEPDSLRLILKAYGVRTDQAKVLEWYRETLELPERFVENSNFHQLVLSGLEHAESIAKALRQAIRHTFPREGKGNKQAFDCLIRNALRQYWYLLRPAFDCLIVKLAWLSLETQAAEIQEALSDWDDNIQRIGRQILNDAIDDLDADAHAIERQVEAREIFYRALRRHLEFLYPKSSTTERRASI